MITDIQSYSKFNPSDIATYSLIKKLTKLDESLEAAFVKNEQLAVKRAINDRDEAWGLYKVAKEKLSNDPSDYNKSELKRSETALDMSEARKHKKIQARNDKAETYRLLRNTAITMAAVTALAGLGYMGYRIASRVRDANTKKNIEKFNARIKELEDKAKQNGGLNKSDSRELASLTKRLSKLAVKVDPNYARQAETQIDRVSSQLKTSR